MTAVERSRDEMTTQNDVGEMYLDKMARCPKNYFDKTIRFHKRFKVFEK